MLVLMSIQTADFPASATPSLRAFFCARFCVLAALPAATSAAMLFRPGKAASPFCVTALAAFSAAWSINEQSSVLLPVRLALPVHVSYGPWHPCNICRPTSLMGKADDFDVITGVLARQHNRLQRTAEPIKVTL